MLYQLTALLNTVYAAQWVGWGGKGVIHKLVNGFDLCDELGLVVWQDLMYACNVYDITENENAFIIEITSDTFTRFVAFESKQFDCIFSKNFFDITSTQPVKIVCEKLDFYKDVPQNSAEFADSLQVQELYQTYNT